MKNFRKARASTAGAWPKDLLAISDLSPEQARDLLRLAQHVKESPGSYHAALAGRHAVLLFEKPSLRTRLTFEIGMTTLGGTASFVDCQNQRLGERESIKDIARNLERWCSVVVVRTFAQANLEELARNASIPVINALSDFEHPSQVLADMLTLQERWTDLASHKVAYVGDPNNVSNSLMHVCAMLGIHFILVSPPGYEAPQACYRRAQQAAKESGGSVELSHDFAHLFGADVIYTDVWASMGQEDQVEKKRRDFAPYRVTEQLMRRAGKNAYFMHCLPAHRGEEVVDSVLDGPRSLAFDQAENRLHVHKALLLKALRHS